MLPLSIPAATASDPPGSTTPSVLTTTGTTAEMIRTALVGIWLLTVLTACGTSLGDANTGDGQGFADAAAEQRAVVALQRRYRFDGPTTTILSRPLTSQEAGELMCVQSCDSRAGYYILILEGEFHSLIYGTVVPTYVPYRPYQYVGAIVDVSSGQALERYASSSKSDIQRWFRGRVK